MIHGFGQSSEWTTQPEEAVVVTQMTHDVHKFVATQRFLTFGTIRGIPYGGVRISRTADAAPG